MVYSKAHIPKSLKNSIWLTYCGEVYSCKCTVTWCTTTMTPFNFEAGHNIPESRGGLTNIENLRPICGTCNKSMGNRYTIDEYSLLFDTPCTSGTPCTSCTPAPIDSRGVACGAGVTGAGRASVPPVASPTVSQPPSNNKESKRSFLRSIMCMQ